MASAEWALITRVATIKKGNTRSLTLLYRGACIGNEKKKGRRFLETIGGGKQNGGKVGGGLSPIVCGRG